MTPYDRRILNDTPDEFMAELPAVALNSPKGVGKTAIEANDSFLGVAGGSHEVDFVVQQGRAVVGVELVLASAV
ncbi:MAG: hypothetical protein LBL92_03695 [Propionibacteriaceae bacterium]|jgi:hypothetical protein|nr:hypothetical protein [Propionibacteriaceae bacterium]